MKNIQKADWLKRGESWCCVKNGSCLKILKKGISELLEPKEPATTRSQ